MKLLVKIAIGAVAVAVLGFLFMRSLRDSHATPYVVDAAHLRRWTLAFTEGTSPNAPVLELQGPTALVSGLFTQIFKRAMESMSAPSGAAIPLLLRGEYDRALAGRVTPEAVMAAARAAGLDAAPLVPRCVAHRRTSDPGNTRQLYYVLFELPAFERFRRQLATLSGGADFDPAALSPVMMVGSAQASFDSWLPLRADPAVECVSPIKAEPGPR